MNHSRRARNRRTKRVRRMRKERRTRRAGMKRARSPQNQGRTSPSKYQGVPIPMGIPIEQNTQEQMPPMGIPLGRGVSRRRHLKKRRSSRQIRGGALTN